MEKEIDTKNQLPAGHVYVRRNLRSTRDDCVGNAKRHGHSASCAEVGLKLNGG